MTNNPTPEQGNEGRFQCGCILDFKCGKHRASEQGKEDWRERWIKERTDAISEMFDNKYANGIYPTTRFFERIDAAVESELARERKEAELALLSELKEKVEGMPTTFPERESDEYDRGYRAAVDCFLRLLQKRADHTGDVPTT